MQILEQFQEPLGLLLRWGHVLAAMTAVGALIFSRFALLPALEDVDEATRARIHEGIRRGWLKWVIGSITILLVTGLANYLLLISRSSTEAWGGNGRAWMKFHGYHAFMGVKILFAFGLFYLASALFGRGEATQWARDDRKKWLTIALGLALAVVIISGSLRQTHTGPNTVPAADAGERMGGAEGGAAGGRGGFGGGMMMDDEFGGGGGMGGGFGGGRRGRPEGDITPRGPADAGPAAPGDVAPPPADGEPPAVDAPSPPADAAPAAAGT